jgi:hypothetical protein
VEEKQTKFHKKSLNEIQAVDKQIQMNSRDEFKIFFYYFLIF